MNEKEEPKLRVAFIHPDLGIGVCCGLFHLAIAPYLTLYMYYVSQAEQNAWWLMPHLDFKTRGIQSLYIPLIMTQVTALMRQEMVSPPYSFAWYTRLTLAGRYITGHSS